LMLMPSVKNAEVFTSNDGRLNVEVSQRTPLFRILNNDGSSFYVDVDGRRMPLSSEYTARVPILTGAVNIPFSVLESNAAREALLEDAIELFRFIEADPLWSAQTEHIVVTNHNEFEIVPRVGAHRILLGNTDHLYDKFARLRSFYDAMVLENNLNKYKRINLKFRNQVVCERYF
jgi:cell division protein FtsQ